MRCRGRIGGWVGEREERVGGGRWKKINHCFFFLFIMIVMNQLRTKSRRYGTWRWISIHIISPSSSFSRSISFVNFHSFLSLQFMISFLSITGRDA